MLASIAEYLYSYGGGSSGQQYAPEKQQHNCHCGTYEFSPTQRVRCRHLSVRGVTGRHLKFMRRRVLALVAKIVARAPSAAVTIV